MDIDSLEMFLCWMLKVKSVFKFTVTVMEMGVMVRCNFCPVHLSLSVDRELGSKIGLWESTYKSQHILDKKRDSSIWIKQYMKGYLHVLIYIKQV